MARVVVCLQVFKLVSVLKYTMKTFVPLTIEKWELKTYLLMEMYLWVHLLLRVV